jgi:hypothetical protein
MLLLLSVCGEYCVATRCVHLQTVRRALTKQRVYRDTGEHLEEDCVSRIARLYNICATLSNPFAYLL